MKTLTRSMMTVAETSEQIRSGSRIFVAGDESLLRALPRGAWIGGSIPYFMSEDGNICSHDLIQVTELPECVQSVSMKLCDASELHYIPGGYPQNGFTFIVIPAFSEAHREFAQNCSAWPGVFDRPLVGWIAGVDLSEVGRRMPAVFNGETGEVSTTQAAVMHVQLSAHMWAEAGIINLFRQGSGDIVTFPSGGFEVTDCLINGGKQNFAKYLSESGIDTRLPLVANYSGAMINASFQSVNSLTGRVAMYAPVFPGVEYRIAEPLGDYESAFRTQLDAKPISPAFSCNCILNYLYAGLEGKKTAGLVGPITFGEIAYMLLNQTLVYLNIHSKH
jgi:hypothetical protein